MLVLKGCRVHPLLIPLTGWDFAVEQIVGLEEPLCEDLRPPLSGARSPAEVQHPPEYKVSVLDPLLEAAIRAFPVERYLRRICRRDID